MKWDARRQILLDIAGDISDDEIIEQTYQLKPLKEKLSRPGTMDQYYPVSETLKI